MDRLDNAIVSYLMRPQSAGNLTRKLMAEGLVDKEDASYAFVKGRLNELLTAGVVSKAGNGKSVHWRTK